MSFFFGRKSTPAAATAAASSPKAENFDLEAEKLFARLNLPNPSGTRTQYNPLDPIWLDFCPVQQF
jgi:hypothetical protein